MDDETMKDWNLPYQISNYVNKVLLCQCSSQYRKLCDIQFGKFNTGFESQCCRINPSDAKVGGLQSQGAKGKAVVCYCNIGVKG